MADLGALKEALAKASAGCVRGCEGRHFSCSCGADDAVETVLEAAPALIARIEALEAENARLREALHDAIARPMGVVPASAEPFYQQDRAALAADKGEK